MIEQEEIVSFLLQFFAERGVLIPQDWSSFNFIESGVLDSFEILTMIVSLETHFSLSIPATLLAKPQNAQIGHFVEALRELA